MAQSRVFREYTKDDSFVNLVIPECVREVQVCLTFARDYDGIHSTNGKFIPYWDTAKVTPDVIAHFKTKHPSAKVLVSVGNCPFKIDSGVDPDAWIAEAVASLTRIVRDYHLDGIDVYYEDIQTCQSDFVHCIGEVIKTLKQKKVITVASITINAAIPNENYHCLYRDYHKFFDTVVCQCFSGFTPVLHHEVDSLKERILAIANQYYPKKNFLVGYSTISEDWANVSPPLFFLAISDLLRNPIINGISIKVICKSIASCPPAWIPELLCLAANRREP